MFKSLANGYSSEKSVRTSQWLDGFQKSLRPCALDEISLHTGRVNPYAAAWWLIWPIQNDVKKPLDD